MNQLHPKQLIVEQHKQQQHQEQQQQQQEKEQEQEKEEEEQQQQQKQQQQQQEQKQQQHSFRPGDIILLSDIALESSPAPPVPNSPSLCHANSDLMQQQQQKQ